MVMESSLFLLIIIISSAISFLLFVHIFQSLHF